MAEYRALSQNTYKFVTEITLNTPMDISDPRRAIIPQLKVIVDDATIEYHTPFGAKYNSSTSQGFAVSTSSGTVSSSSGTNGAKSNVINDYSTPNIYDNNHCVVDGVIYFGVRNSVFTLFYGSWGNKEAKTTAIPKRTLPTCVIKVVKYNSTAGTIITETVDVSAFTANAVASVSGGSSTGACPYAYSHIYLRIPKTSSDIILGMEIEYPKYDITLSGMGLQYSIDNGLTFADVTDGLTLNQVEHVVFKNTGSATKYVGTTEAGSEVATIAAGATFVAVPTASGTWYMT